MKKFLVSVLVSSILVGCGGGDNAPTTPPTPESGPVNMIGSIDHIDHANQTFSVNGYSVKINDLYYGPKNTQEQLDTSILQKGMMLKIQGNTAYLEPTAVGTIQNISPDKQKFTVNGVWFNFDLSKYDIENGNTVIVSSLPVPNGHKVLSVVKIEQETLMYSEIEGYASCAGSTCSNDLLVNIGGVQVNHYKAIHEDGPIKNGDWVEAYGKFDANGIFNAESIEIDNDTDNDFYDDSEIEGFISWVYTDKMGSPSAIAINRIDVELDSNTQYEHGDKSLLTMGREIEVSIVKKGNKLVAHEIEFDDNRVDSIKQEFDGVVSQSVHEISGIKRTLKSFVVKNKTIYIDNLTRFEDGLNSSVSFDGRIVGVEAVNINGKLFAREIELED